MARQPKPEQQQVFKYLEEHPDIELKELKKVFPEKIVKYGSLRLWFISWQESQQKQPVESQEAKQLDIESNHTSEPEKKTNSEILAFLNDNRDTLEKIIKAFNQDQLSIRSGNDDKGVDIIDLKQTREQVSFSIVKNILDDFKSIVVSKGISQRQATNQAFQLWIDRNS